MQSFTDQCVFAFLDVLHALVWVKNTLWACQCLSVDRVYPNRQPAWPGALLGKNLNQVPLLEHIVAQQWEFNLFPKKFVAQGWAPIRLVNQWTEVIVETYCSVTMRTELIVGTLEFQRPRTKLVQEWPTWCGVKNTFQMSVYSKEHTVLILLACLWSYNISSNLWNIIFNLPV
jgi:hypothetical protein